ncbi:RDD family protein [Spirillospora sp. CA-294931]|uniref:RDD family protein n=1 Tax=Spirillospora sp. CA-294931 TaxID=3240042 RepID=UPI003D9073B0
MSDSPRGGQPPQGSYGPPPPYQGPQGQQPQQPYQQPQQPQQPGPSRHWQNQQAPQPQQWQNPPPQQQPQPQQQWQPQQPSFEQDDVSEAAQLPLAPILRRAGARIVDNLLVSIVGFALIVPFTIAMFGDLDTSGKTAGEEGGLWNWPIIFTLFAVLAVLPFIYEAVQLSMWGRTFGKRLLHIGVVQVRPAGEALTTYQAVWRAAINNLAYQFGIFFFLVLAVMAWEYFAYGMLLVWAGALMAYLWAIWDQPLHQAVHDRFAGTLVIDERVQYDESEYGEYEG